ncbi:MAG TPA: hypothetical protein VF660_06915 [Actinomycetota bacterium]|jgi:hypothetical protein
MKQRDEGQTGAGAISTILFLVYVVLGIFVAKAHGYVGHLGKIGRIISLVLAVLLWPLVLLGVNLHIGGK